MESKYVISFLSKNEIRKIVDPTADEVIHYLLKKVAFSQPELTNDTEPVGIQMTKEFLESWIAQSCGLQKVGAGSYPIDVYKYGEFGVDVKSVSAKVDKNGNLINGDSGETSLGQKFEDGETNLDTLFKNKSSAEILSKWNSILENKFDKPAKSFKLKKFYYFIFIRAGNTVYLSIAELKIKNVKHLIADKMTKTSLFVKNFIDDKYGNVKIYKSKKRMELRLKPKSLLENNLLVSWDFDELKPTIINLRKVVENNKIGEHLNSEIHKFFNL